MQFAVFFRFDRNNIFSNAFHAVPIHQKISFTSKNPKYFRSLFNQKCHYIFVFRIKNNIVGKAKTGTVRYVYYLFFFDLL